MPKIAYGRRILPGLFEAERLFHWRPWLGTGFPSFFALHPHSLHGDGTSFNAFLTPIDHIAFLKWSVDKVRTSPPDSEELADVILTAAYCFDSQILPYVKVRFESDKRLAPSVVTACLVYFILMHEMVDPVVIADYYERRAYRNDSAFAHVDACRSIFYCYFEAFPESISDEDLSVAVFKESNIELIQDHVALLGRLVKAGYTIEDTIIRIASWPGGKNLFGKGIASAIRASQNKELAEAFICKEHNAKYPFACELIRGGGVGFLESLLQDYLRSGQAAYDYTYFLPLLASMRQGDSSWLEPYCHSQSPYEREGAAFAFAFYPDQHDQLDHLIKDPDFDVVAAAEFVQAVHAYGHDGNDSACWNLAIMRCLHPQRPMPIELIEAICTALGLSDTDALTDWRLLYSYTQGYKIRDFYRERPYLLAETILHIDYETVGDLERGAENDHDAVGRAILLLCMVSREKGQILLDQLLQESTNIYSAEWIAFLLECCGGPISSLASLKARIIFNRNDPVKMLFDDKDILLVPLLVEDDFYLEDVMKVNAEKICKAFPYALGRWMRKDIDSSVKSIIMKNISREMGDSFLQGLSVIVEGDGENMELPERYFNLDLEAYNKMKGNIFKAIYSSGNAKEARLDRMLSLARSQAIDDDSAHEFFNGMQSLIGDKAELKAFLLSYVKLEERSSLNCAALRQIVKERYTDLIPVLIAEWRKEHRADVLGELYVAITSLYTKTPPLCLMNCSSEIYVAKRYGLECDDLCDITFDDEACYVLLVQGLTPNEDRKYLKPGTYITIKEWQPDQEPIATRYLSIEEFEKIVLRLSVVFEDLDKGLLVCRIEEHDSDVGIMALFRDGEGKAFTVALGAENNPNFNLEVE
jgi:hypothetical protein